MIYLELFLGFLEVGCFSFGGAYGAIPLIKDVVMSYGWASEEMFTYFVAVSESTPGPFAINISTYVGSHTAGILGAVCATLGVVLPSFVIILIVARFFEKFKESKTVQGIMSGLKPAVIGLIGAALVSMALTVFLPSGISLAVLSDIKLYVSLFIFAISTILVFKKRHPILIICLSAVLGIIAGYALGL